MGVVVGAMTAAVVVLILGLPHGVSAGDALHVAGAVGRLQRDRLPVRPPRAVHVLVGAHRRRCFCRCRTSAATRARCSATSRRSRSTESRQSLLLSGFVKIPLQALILITGVLVFTFFLFNPAPMLFNRVHDAGVLASPRAAEYQALERDYDAEVSDARSARPRPGRGRARSAPAWSAVASARRSSRPTGRRGRARARGDARQGRHGRQRVQRRQLRVSDVRPDLHAGRARRADDRRDSVGGHVGQLR